MNKFLVAILLLCSFQLHAQIPDTTLDTTRIDSAQVIGTNDSLKLSDSILIQKRNQATYSAHLEQLLKENHLINSTGPSQFFVIEKRNYESKDILFYAIIFLLLLFGLLKVFYSRYLTTLFRVFFNTSLRQSQLTDQLVQAKLPSMFFNIFFILIAGFYIYLLLYNLGYIESLNDFNFLFISIAAITIIYIIKYVVLKFMGWVSGHSTAADTYIFIVFLINKIVAIALMPIVIIMAFSDKHLVRGVILFSYIMMVIMLALRFLRSYSVLQNKLSVQRVHFFLYIIGIEILPLLLIYKTAVKLFEK